MLRIGETIDRYRVEALVGQGGMAAVYRARHIKLDSEHAIKVLFITAPMIRQRLLREGKVQAALRHPNIVSVTDVLTVLGAPALVMEYVDGPALDAWLLEHKPSLDEALWLFRGILRGISAAHDRGVVHRDLKPANVLLAPTNEGLMPKVTDFGLVKSVSDREGNTQSGMALGTPEYMSPEQIRDASDVDRRSDMWALGCILYELVCHRRAFSGPDKMSTFNSIVAGTYEPPRKFVDDLPVNVATAIRSLLELERGDRLPGCEALYDLLYKARDPTVGRLSAPDRPAMPLLLPGTDVVTAPLTRPHRSERDRLADIHSWRTQPPLDDGPTGMPAQRRAEIPTGLRHGRLTGPPTADFNMNDGEEERRGRRTAIISFLLASLALLAGSWVAWRALVFQPTRPPSPSLAETLPEGAEPAEEAPAVPEPAARIGEVQGDALNVTLQAGSHTYLIGAEVEPGLYEIRADFGDEEGLIAAGQVRLSPGERALLECDSVNRQCRKL